MVRDPYARPNSYDVTFFRIVMTNVFNPVIECRAHNIVAELMGDVTNAEFSSGRCLQRVSSELFERLHSFGFGPDKFLAA